LKLQVQVYLFPWISPFSAEGALSASCRTRLQTSPFQIGGKAPAAQGRRSEAGKGSSCIQDSLICHGQAVCLVLHTI
jgi:hypothetical protein